MATSDKSREPNSNPSISSAEASPARTSVKPGSEPESRELAAAFGLSSPVLLGRFGPDGCSLKTSQASLFTTRCEEWSQSWPDSGMWDLGSAYELQASAPATCESASSSWQHWPTPDTQANRDGSVLRKDCNLAEGGSHGVSLHHRVAAWPTARQEDGESCGNHPGVVDSLTGATRNWPTPQAHDQRGAKTPEQIEAQRNLTGAGVRNLNEEASTWRTPDAPGSGGPRNRQDSIGDGHQVTIAEQAEHWKTPHGMSNRDFRGKVGGCGGGEFALQANNWQAPATDSFRSRGGDRKDEMGLNQQARMFPTPSQRDYRTPNAKSYQERSGTTKGEQLPNFVEHSLPAPLIPDGPPSCGSAPTSRRRLVVALGRVLLSFCKDFQSDGRS